MPKKKMEIKVTSEREVNFYSSRIYDEVPHIVISINTFGCPNTYFAGSLKRKDILRLKFNDIIFSDKRLLSPLKCKKFMHFLSENMDSFDEKDKKAARNFINSVFNESHASIIKEYVDNWKDQVDLIICHCKAGISRSSAVAAAISEYLRCGDREDFFLNPDYSPNQYVFNVLSRLLEGKDFNIDNIDNYELVSQAKTS